MPGTIGKVAAGTNINQTPPGDDKSKSPTSIWDKIAGWAQSDKGMTSIATALMGGVGMLANGKRLDRKLEIEQQAQATNAAAIEVMPLSDCAHPAILSQMEIGDLDLSSPGGVWLMFVPAATLPIVPGICSQHY
jgi:hypothetical protein